MALLCSSGSLILMSLTTTGCHSWRLVVNQPLNGGSLILKTHSSGFPVGLASPPNCPMQDFSSIPSEKEPKERPYQAQAVENGHHIQTCQYWGREERKRDPWVLMKSRTTKDEKTQVRFCSSSPVPVFRSASALPRARKQPSLLPFLLKTSPLASVSS